MADLFFRTEDIQPAKVLDYFVETDQDRRIINQLKSKNPTIVVGSRGVGKSFLIRVAQQELIRDFDKDRALPVYISFVRSSLLRTNDPDQFRNWMLARICSGVVRAAKQQGLLSASPQSAQVLAGGGVMPSGGDTPMESLISQYEASWRNPGANVDPNILPTIEHVREALEDLADDIEVSRFVILIDEAAHIFLPEQQRQFFTLFRDLRSYCVSCNAAVYPGVTSYGDTFQPAHDATMLSITRDVLSSEYVKNMREIVEKQADSSLLKRISQNGQNFGVLAYAASGNPRLLLKTVFASSLMNATSVNETVREFYRTDIWSEHTGLSEKYAGHKALIDWGRTFIEDVVLPEIKAKNDVYIRDGKPTSAFMWIHRDAPEVIKEALRILSYTGIVTELASGIRATRAEVGTRYIVNLGCLFALEATPASTSFAIAKGLTPKRMTEFGSNHQSYTELMALDQRLILAEEGFDLGPQLAKPIGVLDVTDWQRQKLLELDLQTVEQVLGATEEKLKEAHYVGDVRARQMRNAAVASVLEYLSG